MVASGSAPARPVRGIIGGSGWSGVMKAAVGLFVRSDDVEEARMKEVFLRGCVFLYVFPSRAWRKRVETARVRAASGQSTVEFMLMIPVIFATFFFVIELGLYFSAVHYTDYAAFVTARSLNGGFMAADSTKSADQIAGLVLTGTAFTGGLQGTNYTVGSSDGASSVDASSPGIRISIDSWQTNFPFLSDILPNMKFNTTVALGPDEYLYEASARTLNGSPCADNDSSGHEDSVAYYANPCVR